MAILLGAAIKLSKSKKEQKENIFALKSDFLIIAHTDVLTRQAQSI